MCRDSKIDLHGDACEEEVSDFILQLAPDGLYRRTPGTVGTPPRSTAPRVRHPHGPRTSPGSE